MKPDILVVDDDASIRSVIRMALEDAGFCVLEAANGKAALVEHRRTPRALVILDIGMPELDGFEPAKHCAALAPFPCFS